MMLTRAVSEGDPPNNGKPPPSYGANSASVSSSPFGYYADGNSHWYAFLNSNGSYTTLDDPAASGNTEAVGINNAGQIVGNYDGGTFLYSNGVYTDGVVNIPQNSGLLPRFRSQAAALAPVAIRHAAA
jgi:hypothetical protein